MSVAHPLEATVVDYQEFTGRFEAVESVYIQARVSGYLDSIHFTDGQMVAQGDLLYTIDPRPFEAASFAVDLVLDVLHRRALFAKVVPEETRRSEAELVEELVRVVVGYLGIRGGAPT